VLACAAAFDEPRTAARRALIRPIRGAVLAAAALAAGLALAPAWLAARDTSLGVEVWRADPQTAYARLTDAARLNRLSDQPYVVAGTVAERRREWRVAQAFFADAIARNNTNWYSLLELGIADEMTGKHAAAVQVVETARRLNPREPILLLVLRDLRAGRRLPVRALDQAMVERSGFSRRH